MQTQFLVVVVLHVLVVSACGGVQPRRDANHQNRSDAGALATLACGPENNGDAASFHEATPELIPDFLINHSRLRLRAIQKNGGKVYGELSDAPQIVERPSFTVPIAVVEEEANPGTRVRVYCHDSNFGIALWVERSDLQDVVQASAVLAAREDQALAPPSEKTPGVHFEPGARLNSIGEETRPGIRRLTFESGFVRANGFIDASKIGKVFAEGVRAIEKDPNVNVPGGTQFFDAPRGHPFAQLQKGLHHAFDTHVRDGKFALVASRVGYATLVGWVSQSVLSPAHDAGMGLIGLGSGPTVTSTSQVAIDQGALFRSSANGKTIGIVHSSFRAACVRDCETETPRIKIGTRVGTVEVTAVRSRNGAMCLGACSALYRECVHICRAGDSQAKDAGDDAPEATDATRLCESVCWKKRSVCDGKCSR